MISKELDHSVGGRLFNQPRRKPVLKRAESHHCEVNTSGNLLVILARFSRFLQGFLLENRLQNLDGVTGFREERF